MTVARLFLTGIHAQGHHGARPGEKDEAQPFVVDLDLEVEVDGDRIEGTADYRGVRERVGEIVEGESFDLIEAMADRIAAECLTFEHVVKATVVVHKPNAATRLGIDGVAAGAIRERPAMEPGS
jgi:dihydroneopterin aldolase